MSLGTDTAGFLGSDRPWKVRVPGGLSVFETLHLVSDIAKAYKMFGITFLKFPGRKLSAGDALGVSHVTSWDASTRTNRFTTGHRHVLRRQPSRRRNSKAVAGSRPTGIEHYSIQQRALAGAQMRMPGGSGVPMP